LLAAKRACHVKRYYVSIFKFLRIGLSEPAR